MSTFIRTQIYKAQHGYLYESTLGVMAILSLLFLAYEMLLSPPPDQLVILQSFDLAVAWIFLADFIVGFTTSTRRNRYAKENWLNLLSSVPINAEATRSLRILRIARSLRVIRALAAVSNVQRTKKLARKTWRTIHPAK
ncbi:MAG: ion transporter [Candidatus Paceibacterota bacterium]